MPLSLYPIVWCGSWLIFSDCVWVTCQVYVMPTGMEETPKVALDIHYLQRGGGAALTQTINLIPPPRGDGGARAITA